MFKKLRNKLILINLGITSIVIFIVFSGIYIFSTHSANNRPPLNITVSTGQNEYYKDIFLHVLNNEKESAARELLIILIVSGVAIEIIVALVSYYMAEEAIKPVREAYEAQKIFIANASHEIKTPLAVILANLEAADIKNNHWIDNIEKETTRLAKLNSELLLLAKTDLTSEQEIKETDIAGLVKRTIESFKPRLEDKKLITNIKVKNKIKLNTSDFEHIINILLDNAIKYSKSKINISLTEKEFTISNDGAIISEEDIAHIFERFYQVDKSSDGVGLGLSIAKSLVDRNNWKLTAKSTKNETTFVLNF